MAGFDAKLVDWLTRVESWRGNRRQAGGLAAAVLAALTAPEATSGRGRHDKSRQSRADDIPTPAGRRFCGGIAGIPCPKGFVCVDDPRDDCDPRHGGADCSGVCVRKRPNPCATMRCAADTVCCPKCGGLCIPHDVPCSRNLCKSQPCNQTTCQPGEYCCSERCSQCAPLGKRCRDDLCLPDPTNRCGNTICGPDQFCCNPSCSECAPIGGACTARYCPPPEGEPCGNRVCPKGEICCTTGCGGYGICAPKGGPCPMIVCPPDAAAR